jgi:hypothetical protein
MHKFSESLCVKLYCFVSDFIVLSPTLLFVHNQLNRSNYVRQIQPIKINGLRVFPEKQCLSNYALQKTTHSTVERIKFVKSSIAIIASSTTLTLTECAHRFCIFSNTPEAAQHVKAL